MHYHIYRYNRPSAISHRPSATIDGSQRKRQTLSIYMHTHIYIYDLYIYIYINMCVCVCVRACMSCVKFSPDTVTTKSSFWLLMTYHQEPLLLPWFSFNLSMDMMMIMMMIIIIMIIIIMIIIMIIIYYY